MAVSLISYARLTQAHCANVSSTSRLARAHTCGIASKLFQCFLCEHALHLVFIGTPYTKLIVPTVDTVRYSFVTESVLDVARPVFLTGVTGVGKSVAVADLLARIQVRFCPKFPAFCYVEFLRKQL